MTVRCGVSKTFEEAFIPGAKFWLSLVMKADEVAIKQRVISQRYITCLKFIESIEVFNGKPKRSM